MVKLKGEGCAPLVLLGILNSSPLRAFWLDHFYDQRGTFPKIKGTYLKKLPLPPAPDPAALPAPDPAAAITITNAVSELKRLKVVISSASGNELQRLERGLVGQERELDRLVGNLFGLTEEQSFALRNATATTYAVRAPRTGTGRRYEPIRSIVSRRSTEARADRRRRSVPDRQRGPLQSCSVPSVATNPELPTAPTDLRRQGGLSGIAVEVKGLEPSASTLRIQTGHLADLGIFT
jgi:hypothetical protein